MDTVLPFFELLVDAEMLIPHLGHKHLKIVDLTRRAVFEKIHLHDAIHVSPSQFIGQNDYASGKLADPDQLERLVHYLQLHPDDHVVAYDDEGGAWAGRFLWTLHCLGFNKTSLLNGGIQSWMAQKYPLTCKNNHLAETSVYFKMNLKHAKDYQIEYDALLEKVEMQNIQLWDCRTFDEYTGIKQTARKAGHIPTARHYDCSTALNPKNHLKLRSLKCIKQHLQFLGFDLEKPVVVYCQSHHRSGLAYIVGRLLNWKIYAYDGAWSEWANRPHSPTVMGEKPL